MREGCRVALMLAGLVPAALALPKAAAAAERTAPAVPSAVPLPAARPVLVPFGTGPIPGELFAPTAQFSGTYLAPSDSAWRTSPMEQAFSSEGFVVWKPMPVPQKMAVRASVPLPLPRPVLLASAAQQASAAQPVEPEPAPVRTIVSAKEPPADIDALMVRSAERFDVPVRLVRRMVWKESKYNPKARHGPYWGLMQIRVDTARGLGFRGAPADLLDAETNLTYAVAYLANAYRVAGRSERRAEALYTRGYYYEAKRKGMLGALITTASAAE
ncbi:MAG TPA: lytic transglycosylase domain-containing protein [Xanthobacteraceae bacterium]|nr:lytic transglycosylase domain-containing protein [Xanthobacteraceae bacterium]